MRILTTLLDHQAYPARDIAVLYAERWQIEQQDQQPQPSGCAQGRQTAACRAPAPAGPDVHPAGAAAKNTSACSRSAITKGGQAANYTNVSVDNCALTRLIAPAQQVRMAACVAPERGDLRARNSWSGLGWLRQLVAGGHQHEGGPTRDV
jgi:hypothetical protein